MRATLCSVVVVVAGLLAGVRPSFAQEVPLSVKGGDVKTVKVDRVIVVKEDRLVVSSFPFVVTAPPGGGLYFWSYPKDVSATDKGDTLEITAAPKGLVTVSVKSIEPDWNNKKFVTRFGTVTFSVGEVSPTPPVPPGPTPPDPPPTPSPIPEAGFRVLIVYESAELGKLSPVQYNVLFAKKVRDYLNEKCVPGPDGKTREWRIYDKDVDVSGESKIWQGAMKRSRSQVPWILISTGRGGYEGPLPGSVAETLELLKKFGG